MPTTSVELPAKSEVNEKNPQALRTDRIITQLTFFGDSAIAEDHPTYKDVFNLAKQLAKQGYGIVNGGGPGVMKAATEGAESVGGYTTAIYWEPKLASHFEGKNFTNVTDESKGFSNYMMRTLGLIEKGHVFVCCLGGTGTISEFGMVWALAKMYFGRHKPVILYGDFWHPIVNAFIDNMLIDEQETGVLYFADKPEEVISLLDQFESQARMYTRLETDDQDNESAFVINPEVSLTRTSYEHVAKIYHTERAGKLPSQSQLDEFISLVKSGKVLDVGTGPGYDLSYLSQKFQVQGIDSVKKMVALAQLENPGIEIKLGDVAYIDLPENEFDGIWSRDALHHVPHQQQNKVFDKLAKALKPGGILYLIVQEGEGEKVVTEKRQEFTMKRFYHYFDEAELRRRGEKAGLEVLKVGKETRSHKWLIGVFRKL